MILNIPLSFNYFSPLLGLGVFCPGGRGEILMVMRPRSCWMTHTTVCQWAKKFYMKYRKAKRIQNVCSELRQGNFKTSAVFNFNFLPSPPLKKQTNKKKPLDILSVHACKSRIPETPSWGKNAETAPQCFCASAVIIASSHFRCSFIPPYAFVSITAIIKIMTCYVGGNQIAKMRQICRFWDGSLL